MSLSLSLLIWLHCDLQGRLDEETLLILLQNIKQFHHVAYLTQYTVRVQRYVTSQTALISVIRIVDIVGVIRLIYNLQMSHFYAVTEIRDYIDRHRPIISGFVLH